MLTIFIGVCVIWGLSPLIAALETVMKGKQGDAMKQRQIEARIARIQALTDGTAARTSVIVATAEDKKAQETNRVVKGDVEIEILKLKQLQLERNLGLTSQPFIPDNYD